MKAMLKRAKETGPRGKGKATASAPASGLKTVRAGRERVLVEFPLSLLQRTDDAAARLEKNRSDLIRTAVERLLEEMEKKRFEAELAAAYAANAQRNIELTEEFRHVDREGFE